MLFTDPAFLFLLLPAACALFYLVCSVAGRMGGLLVLLAVSLSFYAAWGWENFTLLLASMTVNFVSAYFLLTLPDNKSRHRRLVLFLGVLFNFGALIWFKYRFYFHFAASVGGERFSLLDIAIPVGISFYTFQQATFLLDAYHRDPDVVAYLGNLTKPLGKLRGYLRHLFFVSFFPHLVIGPIIYLKEFGPQIDSPYFGRFQLRNFEIGLTLIVLGMFKKLVLADTLGPMADTVFTSSENQGTIPAILAWIGALAYCAQLYFDFSGYSDMALGTARLFGVRFPVNFYSPFKAVGIVDFYRRWHMTLTRVIARFLFSPLSLAGTRLSMAWRLPKPAMRFFSLWLPLLINFEAIALWHGALTTFVAFGLVHGAWYIAETEIRASAIWKRWRRSTSDTLRRILGRVLFFVPMVVTFALFRSASLDGFFHLVSAMFTGSLEMPDLGNSPRILVLPLAYVIIWLMPNSIELLRNYRPGIMPYHHAPDGWQGLRFAWRPNWMWAGVTLAVFSAALYYMWRQPLFLYMGF